MERIAIMGAGSLGTVLGAYIAKERQVDLIDVNREHVAALNRHGAKVMGKVNLTVPVTALTPGEMEGFYDLVLYIVKQIHNKSALEALAPHLREKSVVCTLQNGYPEPALIEELGADRVLGGTVGWGATWHSAGISELTSEPEHMSFTIGRIDGKISKELLEIQDILSMMCKTYVTETLAESRWAKILVNASFSGMSAALGCTFGDLLDNEKQARYLHYLVNEVIKVSTAAGIRRLPIRGVDRRESLAFASERERMERISVFKELWNPHRALKSSMLQDLEKGRNCEIDAINGVVSSEGKRCGVPTPFCDKIIEIVKGIEAGEYSPSFQNLTMLLEVLQAHGFS